MDSYFDLVKLGDTFDFSLVLFGFAENMTLGQNADKGASADPLEVNSGRLSELNYIMGFLGVGLTLAW